MAQIQQGSDTVVTQMIQALHDVSHWASSCSVRCIENMEEDGMDMCARLCLDAETVAEAMATIAARGSPHAGSMAGCVKDVIADCGDHCARMLGAAGDGQHTMESCAEACRSAVERMDAFISAHHAGGGRGA